MDPGVLPLEIFDIFDARVCILERTQRGIAIDLVDEKNIAG